ncbi:MAG: hypothetical protein ACI8V2_001233 [Candidatus Latescibacterota bacterium]|jgi:hypothetical protein
MNTNGSVHPHGTRERLPREVWVASICQAKLQAQNHEEMIQKMLVRMEQLTL